MVRAACKQALVGAHRSDRLENSLEIEGSVFGGVDEEEEEVVMMMEEEEKMALATGAPHVGDEDVNLRAVTSAADGATATFFQRPAAGSTQDAHLEFHQKRYQTEARASALVARMRTASLHSFLNLSAFMGARGWDDEELNGSQARWTFGAAILYGVTAITTIGTCASGVLVFVSLSYSCIGQAIIGEMT